MTSILRRCEMCRKMLINHSNYHCLFS